MDQWIHQTYMKIRSIVSAQYGCSLTSGASYTTGSYSGKGIYKYENKFILGLLLKITKIACEWP